MIDFAANMTRNLKKSLSILNKSGFRYLSTGGYSFLQKISNNLDAALEQNKQELSASLNNPKENSDQKWVSILNSKENWSQFKKNQSPTQIKDINMLNQFWDSQNQFALASSESLVESLEVVLFCLNHVQDAIKEYEGNAKNKRILGKKFIQIHSLNERLKSIKSQLTNAMLVRLKIAHSYSNRKNQPIPDVDDVVYYISNSLNNRNALNPDEQKILPAKPRQTLAPESKSLFQHVVSGNYYVKFYDCVKMYGESQAEKNQINAFHWSKIINKPVFHLSNSTSKHGFIISIPTFLSRFAPKNYQTPSWWYWQDNAILRFWANRQDFLVNLNHLWIVANNIHNQNSLIKEENEAIKVKCIVLINDELSKISKENPSYFAFTYKEMLGEWGTILTGMRSELLQSIKNSEAETHKPVTHKNMSYENKKECGVKKTQSSKNGQPNILQVLKQSEDEYQNFMSDDLPTKINNPKLSVNTQVPDDFKNPTYISTLEASRFCINGSPKDYTPAKKQLPPKANQPFVQTGGISPKREAALRAHR